MAHKDYPGRPGFHPASIPPITGGSVNWQAIEAIAVLAQTIVLTVALIFALSQARTAVAAQQLQGIHRIHDDIADSRQDRGWFYNEVPADPGALSTEDWVRLNALLTRFDRLATLCEDGIVKEKLLFKSHDAMIARLWHAAEPYASRTRAQPGRAEFVAHLERLGDRAYRNLTLEEKTDFGVWKIFRQGELDRRGNSPS